MQTPDGERPIIKARARAFVDRANKFLAPEQQLSSQKAGDVTERAVGDYVGSISERTGDGSFAVACGNAVMELLTKPVSQQYKIVEYHGILRPDGSPALPLDLMDTVILRLSELREGLALTPLSGVVPEAVASRGLLRYLTEKREAFTLEINKETPLTDGECKQPSLPPEEANLGRGSQPVVIQVAPHGILNPGEMELYRPTTELLQRKFCRDTPDIHTGVLFGSGEVTLAEVAKVKKFLQDEYVSLVQRNELPKMESSQRRILGMFFGVKVGRNAQGRVIVREGGLSIKELRNVVSKERGTTRAVADWLIADSFRALCSLPEPSPRKTE